MTIVGMSLPQPEIFMGILLGLVVLGSISVLSLLGQWHVIDHLLITS